MTAERLLAMADSLDAIRTELLAAGFELRGEDEGTFRSAWLYPLSRALSIPEQLKVERATAASDETELGAMVFALRLAAAMPDVLMTSRPT